MMNYRSALMPFNVITSEKMLMSTVYEQPSYRTSIRTDISLRPRSVVFINNAWRMKYHSLLWRERKGERMNLLLTEYKYYKYLVHSEIGCDKQLQNWWKLNFSSVLLFSSSVFRHCCKRLWTGLRKLILGNCAI